MSSIEERPWSQYFCCVLAGNRAFVRAHPVATLASACVLIMVITWAVWINPINETVNSWTSESLPSNWTDFRDRWHLLHTVRLVLSAVAFSAVIGALLA